MNSFTHFVVTVTVSLILLAVSPLALAQDSLSSESSLDILPEDGVREVLIPSDVLASEAALIELTYAADSSAALVAGDSVAYILSSGDQTTVLTPIAGTTEFYQHVLPTASEVGTGLRVVALVGGPGESGGIEFVPSSGSILVSLGDDRASFMAFVENGRLSLGLGSSLSLGEVAGLISADPANGDVPLAVALVAQPTGMTDNPSALRSPATLNMESMRSADDSEFGRIRTITSEGSVRVLSPHAVMIVEPPLPVAPDTGRE